MQPFAWDQVADKEQAQRTRLLRPLGYLRLFDLWVELIAGG